MGNNSTKSTNKKRKQTNKNKKSLCCLCTSNSLENSRSSSLYSINEKYFPTFDRLISKNEQYLTSAEHKNKKSCEDIKTSLCYVTNINQWIDSLPIHDTSCSLSNANANQIELIKKQTLIRENEQFLQILTRKSNQEFLQFIKKFQLNFYLDDYENRLKNSKTEILFKEHCSSSTIICPSNRTNQSFIENLTIFICTPAESALPHFSMNVNCTYKIHEQIRSKCYFVPLNYCRIEPDDDEYKEKMTPLDRTHVVITLDNNQTIPKNDASTEYESACVFTSNDLFQTGLIHIDEEKLLKELLPFIVHCSETNVAYLSSELIQQWFNTLILVNQTCNIVQRFLLGNQRHITCLIKPKINNQTHRENISSYDNSFTFAALRLPSCTYINTEDIVNVQETEIDGFSSQFLSDNAKLANDYIHIDYEQYSFALILSRWPKSVLDSYCTHSDRNLKRQWPLKHTMNTIIKKPILLVPDAMSNKWKINFDLIEQNLFELMNKSALFFYILCQQLFSPTHSIRTIMKHCFLNYCEKYGLPFSNQQNNIMDLIDHFLNELFENIKKNFFPNYFNHHVNLLNTNENYTPWFDYINKCIYNRTNVSSLILSSMSITKSNRVVTTEFLFYLFDHLYRTLQTKQSQFYLNDTILLDLHQQLCEQLLNDSSGKMSHRFIGEFLNTQEIINDMTVNLTDTYEANAELVHGCLNQIRKSQSSLIYHYTWTIFIQYLHTYCNVLWNI